MRETGTNDKLSEPWHTEAVSPCDSSLQNSSPYRWKQLRLTHATDFPRNRSKHGLCRLGEFVYVYGGKDGTLSLRDLWRFSLDTKRWESVSYQGERLPHLEQFSMLSHRRLIYIFGGEFSPSQDETPLWIYNTDLCHLRKVCTEPGQPHPSGRRQHSAVLYKDAMYIYGGFTDITGSSSEHWRFDFESEEWSLVSCSPAGEDSPGARHGHTAVVYDKSMLVYGGMTDLVPKAELWVWNFRSGNWTRIRTKLSPPSLTGHTADVVGDSMFVLGGENCGQLQNVMWRFRLESQIWEKVEFPGGVFSSRAHHCTALVTPPSRDEQEKEASRSVSLPALRRQSRHGSAPVTERPRTSPAGYTRINPPSNSMVFNNKVYPNYKQPGDGEVRNEVKAVKQLGDSSDKSTRTGEVIEMSTFHPDPSNCSIVPSDKELLIHPTPGQTPDSRSDQLGEDNLTYIPSPAVKSNNAKFRFSDRHNQPPPPVDSTSQQPSVPVGNLIDVQDTPNTSTPVANLMDLPIHHVQPGVCDITGLRKSAHLPPLVPRRLPPSLPSVGKGRKEHLCQDTEVKRRSFSADDLIVEDLENDATLSQLFDEHDRDLSRSLQPSPVAPVATAPPQNGQHAHQTSVDVLTEQGSKQNCLNGTDREYVTSRGSNSYQTTSFSSVCVTALESSRSHENPVQRTASDVQQKPAERSSSYIQHDVACIYVFGGRSGQRRELGKTPISVLRCEILLTS